MTPVLALLILLASGLIWLGGFLAGRVRGIAREQVLFDALERIMQTKGVGITPDDMAKIIKVLKAVATFGYGQSAPVNPFLLPHPLEAGRLADLLSSQLR